jgi:hypothetical protein
MDKWIKNINGEISHICKSANIDLDGKNLTVTGANGSEKTFLLKTVYEKLFDCYCKFIGNRRILKNRDSSPSEKYMAKEHLIQMQDVPYSFSVFWKWRILSNSFLAALFSEQQL